MVFFRLFLKRNRRCRLSLRVVRSRFRGTVLEASASTAIWMQAATGTAKIMPMIPSSRLPMRSALMLKIG